MIKLPHKTLNLEKMNITYYLQTKISYTTIIFSVIKKLKLDIILAQEIKIEEH